MKTGKDVSETFKASVESQINGDRKHGWGAKDSTNVIIDLASEFGGELSGEVATAFEQCVAKVVNPSAFRQYLESAKVNKLDKSDGRKGAGTTFASF